MRFLFIVLVTLFVFTANQAAVAFEQCEDPSCVTGIMDAQKQAEHQKKDPACAAHCAVSCHHVSAMPQDVAFTVQDAGETSPQWATALIPESTIPEGLIEPPSLA